MWLGNTSDELVWFKHPLSTFRRLLTFFNIQQVWKWADSQTFLCGTASITSLLNSTLCFKKNQLWLVAHSKGARFPFGASKWNILFSAAFFFYWLLHQVILFFVLSLPCSFSMKSDVSLHRLRKNKFTVIFYILTAQASIFTNSLNFHLVCCLFLSFIQMKNHKSFFYYSPS